MGVTDGSKKKKLTSVELDDRKRGFDAWGKQSNLAMKVTEGVMYVDFRNDLHRFAHRFAHRFCASLFVPGLPHVFLIELRQAP